MMKSSLLRKGVTVLLQVALLWMTLRNLWSLPFEETWISSTSNVNSSMDSILIPHSLQAFHAQTKQTGFMRLNKNSTILSAVPHQAVNWKNASYSVQTLHSTKSNNTAIHSNTNSSILQENDITLATFLHDPSSPQQLTTQLDQLMEVWKGPVSVAVPIIQSTTRTTRNTSSKSTTDVLVSSWQTLVDRWSPRLTVSLVSMDDPPTTAIPTSKLFQVALDASSTQFVLTMDIHSLPSEECYDTLRQLFLLPATTANDGKQPHGSSRLLLRYMMQLDKTVFVLPSVRTRGGYAWENITSHTILRSQWEQGLVQSSRFGNPWYFPSTSMNDTAVNDQHHHFTPTSPINMTKWFLSDVANYSFNGSTNTTQQGSLYSSIPFHYGWDPHATLVYRRRQAELPRFDDETPVRGGSLQRTAWAEMLDAHGYRWAVAPTAFVVEQPLQNTPVRTEPPSAAFVEEYQTFQSNLPDRYQTHAAVDTLHNLSSIMTTNPINCSTDSSKNATSQAMKQLTCAWTQFARDPRLLRQQIPNALANDFQPQSQPSIALVLHTPVTRLSWLLIHAVRWNGMASVAVCITSPADIEQFVEWYYPHAQTLRRFVFHLFFDKSGVILDDSASNRTAPIYPVNHLRNCALRFATTDYVVLLDNHVILKDNSFQHLSRILGNNKELRMRFETKTLLAIPTFYTVGAMDPQRFMLPSHKNDLRQGLLMRHVAPMDDQEEMDLAHYFTYSEQSTMYARPWSPGLIPHMVVTRRTPDVPWFWTGFSSQSLGRSAWMTEAQVSGYELVVSKQLFGYSLVGNTPDWEEQGDEYGENAEDSHRVFSTYLQMKAQDLDWK